MSHSTQVGERAAGEHVSLFSLGGLYFLSGVSGLLYEVVWLRMLTRLVGNTALATSAVLAVFMWGLGAGSYLAGRWIDRTHRPLLIYAFLELGIGVSAALSIGLELRILPTYIALCHWIGGNPTLLTGVQVATALLMLPPTVMMGATLPVLGAFAGRRHVHFARHVGTLYAMNTFGAVFGVALSGFVLIGAVGESGTLAVGVALNLAIAAGAFVMSRATHADLRHVSSQPLSSGRPVLARYTARTRRVVLIAITVGGFLALANEVVWARLLRLYLGTSVYAFSAMLAVLLAGIGAGGFVGARLVDRCRDPFRLLSHVELGIGFASLVALRAYESMGALKPDLASGSELLTMATAPLLLLGPMGFLWGVSFPAAVGCYVGDEATLTGGRTVAGLYTWNTLGGVVGALWSGFVLVPLLGVSGCGTALAGANILLGTALVLVHPGGIRRETRLMLGYFFAACVLLVATGGDPYYQILRRAMNRVHPDGVTVYRHTEDSEATTTVFGPQGAKRALNLWVDGEGMTALVPITKIMAHLPLWLAGGRDEILVVCVGMGTTVRSASRHRGLVVWAVELIPAVLDDVRFFHPEGPAVLLRPDVHPVADDGRNYLLLHPRQYDVITVDPAPPLYSAGAVNLYTREFFRLCRSQLRPDGVVCLWVPKGNASEVKAIMRTFLDVFEHVTAWESPMRSPSGGGIFLLGAQRRFEEIEAKVRAGYRDAAVVEDLKEWGDECDSPEKVLQLYLADERVLRPWLSGARIITDDRPYTEFPLWRALRREPDYSTELDGARLRQVLGLEARSVDLPSAEQ